MLFFKRSSTEELLLNWPVEFGAFQVVLRVNTV